jgi:V8-like Glu-specific endopeptidase
VEEEDLEKFCERKKILLPSKKFSFNKNLLTVQIIFGYRDEKGTPQYSYISEVNGKHTFIHDSRDLGIVQLPAIQKKLLDDNIGSLPITFFPDQPHEYVDKDITIVGYPGEIEQPSLHAHNGPIKNVDPGKIVFYDLDTTKGNSGSPGLNGIIKDESNIIPVFLTHTHSVTENKINSGQGYDQDFYDFMINKLLE